MLRAIGAHENIGRWCTGQSLGRLGSGNGNGTGNGTGKGNGNGNGKG